MKINIFYNFVDQPYGGANTFLKALKKYFISEGCYTGSIELADIILFNSHSLGAEKGDVFKSILKLKRKFPSKIFIHRVDGPIDFHRKANDKIDKKIYYINDLIVDGTVFVSNWSKNENKNKGMRKNNYEIVINNASNPLIFYPIKNKKELDVRGKINLITTTWSDNPNKGFEYLKYLDDHLNFRKYNFKFIGRSALAFNNIKSVKPLAQDLLAGELRKSDIFFFAGKNESCSNSIIEAINCGLPVVYLDSGANKEIVKKFGLGFNEKSEIIKLIERITSDYSSYKYSTDYLKLENAGRKYLNFLQKIFYDMKGGAYTPKKINFFIYYKARINFL